MTSTKTAGAFPQRDRKGYAIMTHIPAGIIKPEDLERIAAIGKKFCVPIMKITSGQRIILAGIAEEDVPKVFAELGPLARPEMKPGVKFVQACLGTEMCRYGSQDSIALARQIEKRLYNKDFPAKVKIGVSGCPRCCGQSHIRDFGMVGSKQGWTVLFGGNGGTKPRFGDRIARDLTGAEALDCVQRLAEYYRAHAKPHERTARFVERVGIEKITGDLLPLMPYVGVE